jgi:hypothetical protein
MYVLQVCTTLKPWTCPGWHIYLTSVCCLVCWNLETYYWMMCTISTCLVYDACSFQQEAFKHQRMLSLLLLYPRLLGVQHWYCQSCTHIYLWWDPRTWQMPLESPSSMQTTWLNTLRSVVIVRWTWIWFGPGLELDILPAEFPGELESCYLIDDFLSHMATRKWNSDNMFGSVTESLPSTVLLCEWNMSTWVHHWHASIQGSLQSRCVHALIRQKPCSPWNEFLFILNLE